MECKTKKVIEKAKELLESVGYRVEKDIMLIDITSDCKFQLHSSCRCSGKDEYFFLVSFENKYIGELKHKNEEMLFRSNDDKIIFSLCAEGGFRIEKPKLVNGKWL